jgi:hypothetical protein
MDLFFLWQGDTLNEALSLSVREVKEERGAKTSFQAL